MATSTRLIYPEDLNSANRPMMRMRCVKPNIENIDERKTPKPIDIYVPIPVGITFSDAASYNEAELGIIGGLSMTAARNMSAGAAGGLEGVLSGALETGRNALGSVGTRDIIAGVVRAASIGGVSNEIQSGVAIGMGTTLNKNVTTEFTGVGTRLFSFSFKFVSKSVNETNIIKNIIEAFRSNLYPMGNFISLRYPPTWNIQFLEAVVEENANSKLTNLDGTDISYLPKIFECYLKNVTSNFNPTANVWRRDGSPIETDVTVEFIESRALTYEDIKSLEAKPFTEGDFARLYGGGTEAGVRDIINSSATGSPLPPRLPPQTVPTEADGRQRVFLTGPGDLQQEGPVPGPSLGGPPPPLNF